MTSLKECKRNAIRDLPTCREVDAGRVKSVLPESSTRSSYCYRTPVASARARPHCTIAIAIAMAIAIEGGREREGQGRGVTKMLVLECFMFPSVTSGTKNLLAVLFSYRFHDNFAGGEG